jgi:hypothetical protein
VLERLEPYRTAPGGYRLKNVFRVLVAHRRGWAAPSGGSHRPCEG